MAPEDRRIPSADIESKAIQVEYALARYIADTEVLNDEGVPWVRPILLGWLARFGYGEHPDQHAEVVDHLPARA